MEIMLFDENNNPLEPKDANLKMAAKVFIKLEEGEIIDAKQFNEDIENLNEKTLINLIGAKFNEKQITDIKNQHKNFGVYKTMAEAPLNKLVISTKIDKKITELRSKNIPIPKDINELEESRNQLIKDGVAIEHLRKKYKAPDGLSKQEYRKLQGLNLPFVQRRINDLLYTYDEESFHHKWSENNFKDLTSILKNLTMNELISVKEQAKAYYGSDSCDKFMDEEDFENKKKEWQADLASIIEIAKRSNCQDVTAFDTKIDQKLTQTLNNLAKKISNLPNQELIGYINKKEKQTSGSYFKSSQSFHKAKTDLAKLLLAYNRESSDNMENKEELWKKVETFIADNQNVLQGKKLQAFYEQSQNDYRDLPKRGKTYGRIPPQ